jgi:hypothetical protein
MDGTNTTTLAKLFKEYYEPGVNEQLNNANPLLSELESNESAVQSGELRGKYAVHAVQLGRATSAGPRGEDEVLPTPKAGRFENVKVDLTQQYATGSITGIAEYKSAAEAGAFVRGLNQTINDMRTAAEHMINRQVWLSQSGVLATIDTGGVSGSGPWTLTLTSKRSLYATWLEVGQLVEFGTVSGGTVTLDSPSGIAEVTAVDESAGTVTVATYSGTVAPTAGDVIVAEGSANKCLAGISQIVSDTSSTFQNLSPSSAPEWKAVRQNHGSTAFTFRGYEKLRNNITRLSGKAPDLVITTPFIESAAFADLQEQIRYSNPDDLKRGEGVVLPGPGSPKLKSDHMAPQGSLFALNTGDLINYQDGPWRFLNQGGSNLMRFSRRDTQELALAQYKQLAVRRRNSHGELYGITDTSID